MERNETMELIGRIKNDARKVLKNRWALPVFLVFFVCALALLVILMQSLARTLCVGFDLPPLIIGVGDVRLSMSELIYGAVTVVTNMLFILYLPALTIGRKRWFLSILKDDDGGTELALGEARGYRMWRALALKISVLLRMVCWAVPALAPGSVALWLGSVYQKEAVFYSSGSFSSNLLIVLGVILLFCGGIVLFILGCRYMLCDYLYILLPDQGLHQIIRLSKAYMRGNLQMTLMFYLSFTGWFLCCLAIFPALFVIPYFEAARTIFGKYLIESNCPHTGGTD